MKSLMLFFEKSKPLIPPVLSGVGLNKLGFDCVDFAFCLSSSTAPALFNELAGIPIPLYFLPFILHFPCF